MLDPHACRQVSPEKEKVMTRVSWIHQNRLLVVSCSWQWTVVLVKTGLMYSTCCQFTTVGVLPVTSPLPLPENIIPPPSKSAEWESICHTGRHTLRGRRNEHEANDGTGGDGMMVEVKRMTDKGGAADEDSWWLMVEVGKKFTWKRRRRKEKQVHGVQTEMRS